MFYNDLNGITCMKLDTDDTIQNMPLAEYVPYDDFDGIPEIPELTGEPREIDWSIIFDDDCVIIGNEKYPALIRVGDLGEDITLFDFDIGKENSANPEYLLDNYLLMYKDREIGMLGAYRKKDEKPEYAVITSWMFTNYPEYKFPVAVMNIPFSQNFDNILKIYLPPQKNNDSSIKRYLGIAERETEQYMCTLILMNSSVIFNTAPASMNSETYKSFLEELNKQ